MNYEKYLEKYQEIPYKIFKNSLSKNSLFHAYLFVGETGTPLKELAMYFASCILNNNGDFAKEDDPILKNVFKNNYPNFVVLDTKEKQIKIDDIRELEYHFSQTTLTANPRKVYIINEINNLGLDSINALLKFLEEPKDETYAIITTESEFRVLPTIKSRTEIIHFSLINQKELINDAINDGVNEDDAQLLSFFYNDSTFIAEHASEETYLESKNVAISLLSYIYNKEEFLNVVLNQVLKTIKDKISARNFIDLLIVFFKEALKFRINKETILTKYVNIITRLSSLKKLEDDIILLMNSRYEIGYNLNLSLLFINTLNKILENELWNTT